jgi:hypothetical protein
VGGGGSVNSNDSRKVSSSIAGPKFAIEMTKFRELIQREVAKVKNGANAAHAYIVFSDTKNERFFYFADPPPNVSGGNSHHHHHNSKNGPAHAIVWSNSTVLGGIASLALHSTEPVIIEEATSDSRYDPSHEPYLTSTVNSNTVIRTLLAVPIFPDQLSSAPHNNNNKNKADNLSTNGSGGGGGNSNGGDDDERKVSFGTHDIIGVVVLVNKTNGQRYFTAKDEKFVIEQIHTVKICLSVCLFLLLLSFVFVTCTPIYIYIHYDLSLLPIFSQRKNKKNQTHPLTLALYHL